MSSNYKPSQQLAKHDVPQFYLLVCLYFLQGIPVGLAFGTVPFLLKSVASTTSFTRLGLFSMATYPYSLKILWSPIVDSFYIKKTGRRRSWIIPVQLVSGIMLWALGWCINHNIIFAGVDDAYYPHRATTSHANLNISALTLCFLLLIFLCATQDIAVDGWALTILSKRSLSYASTAQTVGLNTGYFLSFTIFLTFNSSDFMNRYLRNEPLDYGLISFGGYLKLAGIIYIIATIYVIWYTTEHPAANNRPLPLSMKKDDEKSTAIEYNEDVTSGNTSLLHVYRSFFKILRLPSVKSLILIHFISKFAFQCNEGATNLKLLEKGFKREDLAISVLIDFPFEIIFGYYVAKWSSDSSYNPHKSSEKSWSRKLMGDSGVLTPWLWGFLGRLVAALMGNYVVSKFPEDGKFSPVYFVLVILQHLLGSFMSTVQFVGISAFHTRIADPAIGGTYMTLLNTLSNLGGTWPRVLVMCMIDYFTTWECRFESDKSSISSSITKQQCTTQGGTVLVVRDGYYITNLMCVTVGFCLFFGFIKKRAQLLQRLPVSEWRCE